MFFLVNVYMCVYMYIYRITLAGLIKKDLLYIYLALLKGALFLNNKEKSKHKKKKKKKRMGTIFF